MKGSKNRIRSSSLYIKIYRAYCLALSFYRSAVLKNGIILYRSKS